MIGGNVSGIVQERESKKDEIGSTVKSWKNICVLNGFLDLSSGDSKRTVYHAKIRESTHVFICDYKDIKVNEEKARMLIDSKNYDVLYIDDPMGLHEQLEIYLKCTGG